MAWPFDNYVLSPGQPTGPKPFDYSSQAVTDMLDLKRLGLDFQKAKEGDPDARRRLSSPGLADSVLDLGPTKDRTSEGLSAAVLPEARRVGPQEPLGSKPGGGGVTVSSAESPTLTDGGGKMDWAMLARVLGAGLSDIAGSVGPGKLSQSPIHAMTMDDLRTSQLSQLKRRQDMWDDAWKQSQQLPGEIMQDERFAGLAQAKAALEKDLQDGKIDNEKNVSTFLTEMARSKKDLEELQRETMVQNQLAQEEALGTGRREAASRERLALEEAAAAGDPQAQSILRDIKAREAIQVSYGGRDDIYMPASQWYTAERSAAEAQKERDFRAEQATAELNARAADRAENRKYREAMQNQQGVRRAVGTLGPMIQSATIRFGKGEGPNGEPISPEMAYGQALEENAVGIENAARAAGIQFSSPQENGTNTYIINGKTIDASNPAGLTEALSLLYQLARTDY